MFEENDILFSAHLKHRFANTGDQGLQILQTSFSYQSWKQTSLLNKFILNFYILLEKINEEKEEKERDQHCVKT